MRPVNRVIGNTFVLYARMGITMFISLYTTRVILAALGVHDFGIYNVVAGSIAMLLFLNASMTAATQRFMSYAEGMGDKKRQIIIFNVAIRLHFAIGIVVVLLLEGAGYFFFNGILRIEPDRMHAARLLYQFMVASTFFTIQAVPYDAVVNAHENMVFLAILNVVESVLKLCIALYISICRGDRLIVYGLQMASIVVLLFIVRIMYCRKYYPEARMVPHLAPLDDLREMTGFAGWTFVGTASSMLANYGQGIILNMFFGTAVNAAQGVAGQICGQISVLSRNMLQAVNPIIAKSEGAGSRRMMVETTVISCKFSYLLIMIPGIPIIMEMDTLFSFWLKEVPPYAVIFTRLLIIRAMLEQLFLPLSTSISAVGRIRNYQIVQSITSIMAIAVGCLTFKIGMEPVSIYYVFILYAIVNATTTMFYANKLCGISYLEFISRAVWPAAITTCVSLPFALIPYFLMDSSLIRIPVVFFVSVISSFVAIFLAGMTGDERLFVVQTIQRLWLRLRER